MQQASLLAHQGTGPPGWGGGWDRLDDEGEMNVQMNVPAELLQGSVRACVGMNVM